MHRTIPRLIHLLLAALVVPLLLSACGHAISTTSDDATITVRVKTALLNEPDVAIARIEVDTFKGVVTLSGTVKSKEDEAKAIAAARRINGVTDVKSNLKIGQPPRP
jgi:osmotically-inducible protein OsmY